VVHLPRHRQIALTIFFFFSEGMMNGSGRTFLFCLRKHTYVPKLFYDFQFNLITFFK
jgi:hypothetical protein